MNSHHHTDDDDVAGVVADPRDGALLRLLGDGLRTADPVPDHVLAAARGAVAWRTIDQDLADLVFDSTSELTGVRDPNAPRQLTFRSHGVEIEVMLVDSSERRLVGQLVPPRATTVTLQGTDAEVEQETDRLGRFTFDRVQSGPVRLTVAAGAGERVVATDWMLL